MTIPDGDKQNQPYFDIVRDPASGSSKIQVYNITEEQERAIYEQLSLLQIDPTTGGASFTQSSQCVIIQVSSPQNEETVCRALNQQKIHQDVLQPVVERLNRQVNKFILVELARGLTNGLDSKKDQVPTQVSVDRARMLPFEIVCIDSEGRTIIDKPPGSLIEERVLQRECAKGVAHQLAMLACTQVSANPGAYIPTKLRTDFLNQHSDLCIPQMKPAGQEGVSTQIILIEYPLVPGEKHPRWRLNYAGEWGIQAKGEQFLLVTGTTNYQCDLVLKENKKGSPVVEVEKFTANSTVSFPAITKENAKLVHAIQSSFLSMNLSQ